jgi:predicted Zn-dependent protease
MQETIKNTMNSKDKMIDFVRTEFNLKYKNAADFVAFKFLNEKNRDFTVRNGKTDNLGEYTDTGLLIEVMVNGHIGYGATSELSSAGIKQAFDIALETTKKSAAYAHFYFNHQVRPANQGTYQTKRNIKLDQLSVAEIYSLLKKTSETMKKRSTIVSAVSDAMIIENSHQYLSSLGADIYQEFDLISHSMTAIAQQNNETQIRSLHGGRGNSVQAGAEYFNLKTALEQAEQIAAEAEELLSAENCPFETTDLILAPDQMLLQIHESIGHPLELDRILGDERNFAGWSFVQKSDFGKLQYGSPIMNVVFEPDLPGQFASYNFDDIGNRAEKKYLIQNGVLVAGLGSLESQMRSQISGVANARSSSWNRAPIDRMANINLEGGKTTLDQMISKTERGVMMFANRSWSIDDYRRKFQFGCEYGKLIENGKITKTLKNPNYRGVTTPFWNSLTDLSPANTIEKYGSPYCGKGEPSQIIRVGHASPYALFKNIEIFGGSK